jgi:ADP-heptose:LPS heptosyltransferase
MAVAERDSADRRSAESGSAELGSAGPRLLVLRALGLGDLLTGVPAYRGLRRAFGRHWVVLAAPPALAQLALLTGAVDEVLPFAAPAAGDWPPLPWPGSPPDIAVNLHGRGPQSHQALVELWPRRLWGFAHSSFPAVGGPAWPDDEHEVTRWCRLLAQHSIPADPADLAMPHPPERASTRPGAVVVHPGAAYPARRWPADRFAAVAAALHRAGHQVVISGAAAERGLAVAVAELAGLDRADVLAGRTDVLDLAALLATARLVVCGDTGVGHLATAYGVPSVLLFGPTPPAEWGPPPGRRQHVVLWHGTGSTDPRHDQPSPALLAISVGEVLDAATAQLDRAGQQPEDAGLPATRSTDSTAAEAGNRARPRDEPRAQPDGPVSQDAGPTPQVDRAAAAP